MSESGRATSAYDVVRDALIGQPVMTEADRHYMASGIVAALTTAGFRLTPPDAHHEGAWAPGDLGECQCECPRCWNGDNCVCPRCPGGPHDHPARLIAPARTLSPET